jgi:hypothetical protein
MPALAAAISAVRSVFDNFFNLLIWLSVTIPPACLVAPAQPPSSGNSNCRYADFLIVANHQDQQRIEKLEKRIRQKDEVLAELMAEHVALKKELGEL